MFHEMCLQLLHRKLYLAPIEKPQRVIDLGTGTGIWAVDFGKYVYAGGGIRALTRPSGPTPGGRGK